MAHGGLTIDGERLWADLMTMGEMTEPGRPYTRRAFSPLFDEGRAFLSRRMIEAGLKVRVDAAGNLIGRLEGAGPGVIAMGSHSDTVPGGGRFDGVAGVVAALEVVRALAERGERPRHAIEVIDCLAEEPTDFGLSCVGSRGMAGKLDAAMLAQAAPGGDTLGAALRRVGGEPDALKRALRQDLVAFLELHIEQGPVLEAEAIPIGVVTSIVGIRRQEIVFQGKAAHAGTAPMHLRQDAGVAAAAVIGEVRRLADQLAAEGSEYFVATVGIVQVEPGGSNVVPGRARIVIDARASHAELIDRFTLGIDAFSARAAAQARVERTSFAILSNGTPSVFDLGLREALHRAARKLDLPAVDIASGAGHDAAFLAGVCPSAMVFVPCLDGMSHNPDEWADRDAVAAGAAVLFEAVLDLDRRLMPSALGIAA